MQEIRLKRMNHPDLVFKGDLVASVDQQTTANIQMHLQLSLYKTAVGRLILAVVLRHSQSSGPKIYHGVLAFDSAQAIHDFLVSEEGRGLSEATGELLQQTGQDRRFDAERNNRIHQGRGHVERKSFELR